MLKDETVEVRSYQVSIANKAAGKNTLVVLPTGLGKTQIAILVAANRLESFPGSKVLIVAPTRPLAEQHLNSFTKSMNLVGEQLLLVTGNVAPEKREKMYKWATVICATPQCVTEDTEIFVENKGPMKIKDFVESFPLKSENYGEKGALSADVKNERVIGYKKGSLEGVKVTKVWKIAASETVKIETELKNAIECTPEHPLLSMNDMGELRWVPAENLSEGMHIAMAKKVMLPNKTVSLFELIKSNPNLRISDRNLIDTVLQAHKKTGLERGNISWFNRNTMPLKLFFEISEMCRLTIPDLLTITNFTGKSFPITVPRNIDSRLFYLIGAMIGDGHIGCCKSKGSEVVFSALDKQSVMSKFEKYVLDIFGLKPKREPRKGLIYYSTALAEIFISLGIPQGEKGDKVSVPSYVFYDEEECAFQFLSGLFDTDGSAAKHGVTLVSTVSRRLANDVKWLLLKLGIPSSIDERENKSVFGNKTYISKTLYSVRVSGDGYNRMLLERCEFDHDKTAILSESMKNIKRPGTRSKEILPAMQLIRNAYEAHRANGGKKMEDLIYTASCNSLRKLLPFLRINEKGKIEKLINLPIRWVKIKSIKRQPNKRWVYDLTVENEHNFIGNWIINHNTIANDIVSGRLELADVSLLVVDEVHRAVKKYAYPIVAGAYLKRAEHPRVLGLTASPGSDETRINEICRHLGIEAVEIRNESDKDVEQYVQEQEIDIIKVELEGPLLAAEVELKLALNERMKKLKDWGLHVFSKKDLLVAQKRMQDKLKEGKRPIYYQYLSGIAETIKLWHALELVETQSVAASSAYLEKIADGDSRAAKRMTADPKVDNAIRAIRKLKAEAREHPKTVRLCETIRLELEKNPKLKIIVFSHYRDNITEIARRLRLVEGCRPAVLIGQSGETGLSQREQISIIRDYDCDVYNTLITSPIGEEGLHLASADLAIFYEPVPSEVRTIQRRGRVGRTKVGRIIMFITKGTRDETNFYVAKRKEAKMNEILHGMQNGEGQKGLIEF